MNQGGRLRLKNNLIFKKSAIPQWTFRGGNRPLFHNSGKMTFSQIGDGDSLPANGPLCRRLYIDFAFYTEGDQVYKKELVLLLIDNLIELRRSLTESMQQHNPGIFLEAFHKATVTLSVLADKEFNEIIEELKRDLVNLDKDNRCAPNSNRFYDVCDLIIS